MFLFPRVFAQMLITIPSKGVFGNTEQLIENGLFDVKLPKLKHYRFLNTVAEVVDTPDVSANDLFKDILEFFDRY